MNNGFKKAAVVLVLFIILGTVYFRYYRQWHRQESTLRAIESTTGVKFPHERSGLVIDYQYEFCVRGRMKLEGKDNAEFLRQAGFGVKTTYPLLEAYGLDRERFKHPETLNGWLGMHGSIEGKNGWEFAYDPTSKQLWLFFGWSTSDSRSEGKR
jgi:hypothetical protein